MNSRTAVRRTSAPKADAAQTIGSSPQAASRAAARAQVERSAGVPSKYVAGNARPRHSSADPGRLGDSSSLPLLPRASQGSRVTALPLSREASPGGLASGQVASARSAAPPSARGAASGRGLTQTRVSGDERLKSCADDVARIDVKLSAALSVGPESRTIATPAPFASADAARACAVALRELSTSPAALAVVPGSVSAFLVRLANGLDVALQGLGAPSSAAVTPVRLPPVSSSAAGGASAVPEGGEAAVALASEPPSAAAALGSPHRPLLPLAPLGGRGEQSSGGKGVPSLAVSEPAAGASASDDHDSGADDDDDDDGFNLPDDGSGGGIQIVRVPSSGASSAAPTAAAAAALPPADAAAPEGAATKGIPGAAAETMAPAALAPPQQSPAAGLPVHRAGNAAQQILQRRGLAPGLSPGGGVPRLGLNLVKPGGGGADYHAEFMAGAEDWSLSWREEAGMHPLAALDAAAAAAALAAAPAASGDGGAASGEALSKLDDGTQRDAAESAGEISLKSAAAAEPPGH